MKNSLPVVDGGTAQSWVEDKPSSTKRASQLDLGPRSSRPPAPRTDPPTESRLRAMAFTVRRLAEIAWHSVRRDPS